MERGDGGKNLQNVKKKKKKRNLRPGGLEVFEECSVKWVYSTAAGEREFCRRTDRIRFATGEWNGTELGI